MKSQYSFLAVVLIVFIVINAVFMAGYVARTDFSWPEFIFENYEDSNASREAINVSLAILPGEADYSYSLSMPDGSMAADLLQKANEKYNIGLKTKSFGDAGLFVDSLMGKTGDSQTNTYWIYYINGKSATIGVSQYELQDGDKIEFKYEKAVF